MALSKSGDDAWTTSRNLHVVVIATGTLSVACCFLVVASYLRYSRLRMHPSQLLFYRTVMDLIQAVVGIVVSVLFLCHRPLSCSDCVLPSLIYQAAIFGSGCWYLIMAVDLHLAIRNPFICHEDYTRYYHVAVWSTTAVTVAIIGITGQYGPDTYGVCWIKDHNCTAPMAKDKITPYKFLELAVGIYFGPYLLAYVVILVILAFARVALRKGMPNSDEVRKRVLQHSFVYVFCYSLQWTIYAGLWLAQIILLLQNDNDPLNQTRASLAITATAVFGLNGVLDFAVWMWSGQSVVHFINRRCLSSQSNDQLTSPLISDPGIVARQEVSAALRRDAMVCTSWAILDSVNVGMPAMEHARRDSSSDLNYLTTDFKKVVKKWIFPPDGTHKFEFKDYAPETFAQLRAVQAIEADSYSTAFRNITKHDSDQELLEKFSDGKSGSFFYFSLDSRFIVKTVTLAELNFLRGILCHYYKYITDNPDSLLTRIYGLHRIRLAPHQKYLSMAVMGNILPRPGESCVIHEKYDLKGSSVGRRVLKRGEDRSSMDLSKKTLKDCDLVRKIVIGEDNKRCLLEQLRRDADFLASIGVMDYSLLLGIHFCDEDGHNKRQSVARAPQRDNSVALSIAESENSLDIGDTIRSTSISVNTSMDLEKYKPIHLRKPRRHGSSTGPPAAKQSHRDTSSYLIAPEEGYVPWFRRDLGGLRGADSCHPERRCIYYMGIIDILQRYDWSKKTERFLKTKLLCKDGENISATNVLHYSQRFIEEIGGRFE